MYNTIYIFLCCNMLESHPVSMNFFHFHRISSISFIQYFDNFLLRFYNLTMGRNIHLFILCVYVSIAIQNQCFLNQCIFSFHTNNIFHHLSIKAKLENTNVLIYFVCFILGFYYNSLRSVLNQNMVFTKSMFLFYSSIYLYLYSISNCLKRLPFNT